MTKRILITITVVVIALLTVYIATQYKAHERPREHYDNVIQVGMDEQSLMNVLASDRWLSIGQFTRHANGGEWKLNHVQGDPITKSISPEALTENQFWNRLGWTYPTHPIKHKAIVVSDTQSLAFPYIYIYLTAEDQVDAIFIGGS